MADDVTLNGGQASPTPPDASTAPTGTPPTAPAGDAVTPDKPLGLGDGAAPEPKAEPDKKEAPQGAPEKYDFKFAEGVVPEETGLAEFETTARELNLSNEAAQRLIDLQQQFSARVVEQQVKAFEDMKATWAQQVRTDAELGGAKLDENLAIARRGYNAVVDPTFRKQLNEWGLELHPGAIRTFHKIGLLFSEDGTLVKGSGTPKERTARDMYPNSNMT